MRLHLDPAAQALLSSISDEAVLGIICQDGRVLLRSGDAVTVTGHRAWLQLEAVQSAHRGFSLVVRECRVRSLFLRSVINPPPQHELEHGLAEQLERILPLTPVFAG